MTIYTLVVMGILLPIKAYNMILVVGVLRSGGDTRFSMLTELAGVWFIGVPLAFIGALLLKLPIYYLYLFIAIEEVFKFIVGMVRIKSGRWINLLIEETPLSLTQPKASAFMKRSSCMTTTLLLNGTIISGSVRWRIMPFFIGNDGDRRPLSDESPL